MHFPHCDNTLYIHNYLVTPGRRSSPLKLQNTHHNSIFNCRLWSKSCFRQEIPFTRYPDQNHSQNMHNIDIRPCRVHSTHPANNSSIACQLRKNYVHVYASMSGYFLNIWAIHTYMYAYIHIFITHTNTLCM